MSEDGCGMDSEFERNSVEAEVNLSSETPSS